jgi:murein DD-endopeptidase MepM/ murein hydrolase activator NlpD
VKKGDRVRTGQTVAAVGNNGATTGPHLHFQLMDNTNFDMAEGVPYEFNSFVLVGHVNQKTGQQLLSTSEPHTKQLTLTFNIVNFRNRR